jgi:hypothetical protein
VGMRIVVLQLKVVELEVEEIGVLRNRVVRC